MPDYKEMYLMLLRSQNKAIEMLQETHRQTEEMFISANEPEPVLLHPDKEDEGVNPPE